MPSGTLGRLPSLGDQIGRYTIVAEIAHGGMAAVYAVLPEADIGFDKLLAMKVMLPHLVSEERFVTMFLDEARIAARIAHPNVVQVFDVGATPTPHLVMELLHGASLSAFLRRGFDPGHDPHDRARLMYLLASVSDGLHAAHEARTVDGAPLRIVHRDVSPQNVLLGHDGQVKVADFGVAAARGKVSSTATGEIKGKLSYLAPEQLHRRSPVDHRADLWALGVMAYETLTGRSLFGGDTEPETMWNILHRDVPDIEDHTTGLSRDVATLIHRCLARAPHDRPESAAEASAVFHAAAVDAGKAVGASSMAERMHALLGDERRREEVRLAEAVRATRALHSPARAHALGGGSTTAADGSAEGTRERTAVTQRVLRRRRGPAIATAAAALLLGAVGVALGRERTTPRTAETPRQLAIDEPAERAPAPASPEPASTSADRATVPEDSTARPAIRVEVGPGVRMVLVDGMLTDQRPVVAAVGQELTLVGRDRTVHHRVTAADDGSTLVAAPGRPRARRRSPRSPTPRAPVNEHGLMPIGPSDR